MKRHNLIRQLLDNFFPDGLVDDIGDIPNSKVIQASTPPPSLAPLRVSLEWEKDKGERPDRNFVAALRVLVPLG